MNTYIKSLIPTKEKILNFLSIEQQKPDNGYGNGTGCGSGHICESGYGHNGGALDGSDNGYCDNSFHGRNGYSYDYGYGYGDGDSYGGGHDDGTGYGNGVFYQKDITVLNGNIVYYIDDIPTIITQVRDNFAKGFIVKKNLELSPCFIVKVGNSFSHGKTIKEAFEDAKSKEIKETPIEERIEKFMKKFGDLESEHTGIEFYKWHNVLTNSCLLGRNVFCEDHNIDLTKKYTVRYFLDITKNSYGSYVIKLLRKAYGIVE